MATTNLIPLHAGKDGSISRALQRTIDYIENPLKTENRQLVTSYRCDPRTVAAEFFLDKRTYRNRTGRENRKDDVIAYHLRQSFAPGEITPEEANRLGYELAMRFTTDHDIEPTIIEAEQTTKYAGCVNYRRLLL